MKKYTIKKVDGEPDWSKVESLQIDHKILPFESNIKAFAKIAYSDSALFVYLRAVEKNIRAEEKIPYGSPCDDSCLEFFFCPIENDPHYFNIEFSPSGCMYLGVATGLNDLIRLVPDYSDSVFNHKISFTDDGWEIAYSVPFDFIRRFYPAFSPKSGYIIRANCFKCGDKTKEPHFLDWNPVRTEPKFTFHRPEDFGMMILE